jgi:hypothetical protein
MKDNFRKIFLSQDYSHQDESRGSSVFDMSSESSDDPSWLLEATGKNKSGNRKLKRTFTFPATSKPNTRNTTRKLKDDLTVERPRFKISKLPKPNESEFLKPEIIKKVEFNDDVTSIIFDEYISTDEELSQDIENVCFISQESSKKDEINESSQSLFASQDLIAESPGPTGSETGNQKSINHSPISDTPPFKKAKKVIPRKLAGRLVITEVLDEIKKIKNSIITLEQKLLSNHFS